MFGLTTKKPAPQQQPAEPQRPRIVRPQTGLTVPGFFDDDEYAKCAASVQRCAAKVAALRQQREAVAVAAKLHPTADGEYRSALDAVARAALASLDSAEPAPFDAGVLEELKKFDAEIAAWERAEVFAAEKLREVERFAARRLGVIYSRQLDPLRNEAIARLTEAHDLLLKLFFAWDEGDTAGLNCGIGFGRHDVEKVFQLVLNLKEFAITDGAVSTPAPAEGAA